MVVQVISFYNNSFGHSLFNGATTLSGVTQIDVGNFDVNNEDAILKQLHLKLDERQARIFIDTTEYEAHLCKENEETAYGWHVLFSKTLSAYASSRGIRVIRLSTFAVFDGSSYEPYVESDEANAKTVYGNTMQEGEYELLSNNPNAIVVRLPWVYSAFYKSNFVYKLIEAMFHHEELYVFDDQVGNLCNLFDLQQMLYHIIDCLVCDDVSISDSDDVTDRIYHLSPKGFCSKFEIAEEIWRTFSKLFSSNLKTKNIIPVPSKETNDDAQANCCISSRRFLINFKKAMPDWHFSLYNATQKAIKSIGNISSD
ncbi:MAG: sugar nucleotide-binding protein [Alphaproteobacteria bacterium]|nr:sugar nucleotide-binding protein [Rickettsiales bacterium]